MSFVILNGEIKESEKARLSFSDRGLLLGDGLFETMRAYEGEVFKLKEHLDRLFRSAAFLFLDLPWREEEVTEMISRLLEVNELSSARVRLTLTRGQHDGKMSLCPSSAPTLLLTAQPLAETISSRQENGISLVTAELRFSEQDPFFQHKTLNRLPYLLARTQAEKAGADEALILTDKGNVASTSTGNLFALQADQLFTPPLSGPLLPGITRQTVLSLASAERLALREAWFSPLLLQVAEEIFMTNSVQEIVPVVRVNQWRVGNGKPGAITRKLQRRYQALTGEKR